MLDAHVVRACLPFARTKCGDVLTCEFACKEHRDKVVATLSDRLQSSCAHDNVRLAMNVVARDTLGCNSDMDTLLKQHKYTSVCPTPSGDIAAMCANKMWYTHRQTLYSSIVTFYLVVANLSAWVLTSLVRKPHANDQPLGN